MSDEELKHVSKLELEDEILNILFYYLIRENDKKDKVIKSLVKERRNKNVTSSDNN